MAKAADGIEHHNEKSVHLFTKKVLSDFEVVRIEQKFIEVVCGITSPKHGDFVGKLRIYAQGKLEITCECLPGCPEGFEKHAGYRKTRKWKKNIWVMMSNGKKIELCKTKLLKYYKGSASDPSEGLRPYRGKSSHHDEFITCVQCGKERRFFLRTEQECRAYHDATFNKNWSCTDYPHAELNCEDDVERACQRKLTGCPRKPTCKGCKRCVCFGCDMCRFKDCSCRSCVDYIQNAEPTA